MGNSLYVTLFRLREGKDYSLMYDVVFCTNNLRYPSTSVLASFVEKYKADSLREALEEKDPRYVGQYLIQDEELGQSTEVMSIRGKFMVEIRYI